MSILSCEHVEKAPVRRGPLQLLQVGLPHGLIHLTGVSRCSIPRLCGCDNGMKRYGVFMVINDDLMVIFMVFLW
jgi:hypothetical protein